MKLRALVIDDSRIMRGMVMQSLRNADLAEFVFTEAVDGLDGTTKFSPDTTDIVFADWNMPNMSGIEFVRQVRSAGDTDHIPIIMVTSEASDKIEDAIVEAGANGHISKPFTVEQLQQKLAGMINQIGERAAGG